MADKKRTGKKFVDAPATNNDPFLHVGLVSDDVAAEIRRALRQQVESPRPGDRIGAYLLEASLGAGQFGTIWRSNSDGKQVAIKVFRREQFGAEPEEIQFEAAARFWAGASSMRELSGSPRIVPVLDGPSVTTAGHIWFAMEFFPDRDLEIALRANRLKWEVRLEIVSQLIESVKVAHENATPLVHRDIRPANVLLRTVSGSPLDGQSGSVDACLCDFDIAFWERVLRGDTTKALHWKNARYFPPETTKASPDQMREVFRRKTNDLYALSVVVLELFAGKDTEIHTTEAKIGEVLKAQRLADEEQTRIPRAIRGQVALFCARGLHSVPSERFQSIGELSGEWKRLRKPGLVPRLLGLALILSAGIVLILVLDWVAFRVGIGYVLSVARVFSAGVAALVVTAAVKWLSKKVEERWPSWLKWLNALTQLYAWPSCGVIVFLVAVSVVVVVVGRLSVRIRSFDILNGQGCLAGPGVTPGGVIREAHATVEVTGDWAQAYIRCQDERSVGVLPRSVFSLRDLAQSRLQLLPLAATDGGVSVDGGESVDGGYDASDRRRGCRVVESGTIVRHNGERANVGSFCIGTWEVTGKEFAACPGCGFPASDVSLVEGDQREVERLSEQCWRRRKGVDGGGADVFPINCISRAEAQAYCAWTGGKLPTMNQWFLAVGTGSPWAASWTYPSYERRLNFCGAECKGRGDGGSFYSDPWKALSPANTDALGVSPAGVAHLVGNVSEWVDDVDGGFSWVVGGSWDDAYPLNYSKLVRRLRQSARDSRVGVRCVYE